ncbi:MAG: Crp/Fnr family transcriptional regulator [Bacteroidota bacterium]
MDELITYLLQYGNFNSQQIDLIKGLVKSRKLKKGDYFSEAGNISKEIAFVKKGIFRVCYFDKEGNEITKYFVEENHFAVDITSYMSLIPSSEYIQAITDMELLIFKESSMETLSQTIIIWDQVVDKITSKAMIEKFNKTSLMMAEDATTRYLNFQNRFPSLVNRIPLQYLASYIGVTKHSLSRIRKEIST